MRIHLGTDHAGFELKEIIKAHLQEQGHEVIDHGALEYDKVDNYPVFCYAAARAVRNDEGSLGVVFGGSGNGEQMAANKIQGVRAALVWNIATAELAREHNDAQIIALGARQTSPEDAIKFVDAFVSTPFSEDPRHQRRIDMLNDPEAY
jgi:ribose 5-phosphate isomerase B